MAYNDPEFLRGKPADGPRETITSFPNDNPKLSTVDKTWGPLFDGNSPTERFGQLTRGIANHINDMYTPQKTLAIPPAKMAEFYATYKLEAEKYPLKAIFQVMPHDDISWIYRHLGCQYFLVQDEDLTKAPTIPALTPVGFSQWMTLFVLAHPSEESQRLDKVVLLMPIDADGVLTEKKPQRLPKQLSRYLLPLNGNHELKKLLKFALPGFKNFIASSQTSSKIPIVNSKRSSTKHHDDPYSREFATSKDPATIPSLEPDTREHPRVHFRHNQQANSAQQRKKKVVVHNSSYNKDWL